jgi:3-oxoacyl-[acyl-carrier protein] reductase
LVNILISGSSRGLGRELAAYFKQLDFRVITMGNETKNEVDIRCDLRDKQELDRELQKYFSTPGVIDILICNAGTGKLPEDEMSKDQITDYFYTKNYVTALNLIDSASKYLRTGNALVVAISSIAAITEIRGAPMEYRESKAKMNSLFFDKAKIGAKDGIRFNIISPGNIYFEGSRWEEIRNNDPEFVKELLTQNVPLGDFISPAEIAEAILYLFSPMARNVTGINLVIDGGQSL